MKPALNEQFKTRYFQQYGQCWVNTPIGTMKLVGIVKSEIEDRWLCLMENSNAKEGHFEEYVDDCSLPLRPLSDMTDEEAKIASLGKAGNREQTIKWIEAGIENQMLSYETADYLRSSGFALPFMGYTVEELISAGCCKIQEVKNG